MQHDQHGWYDQVARQTKREAEVRNAALEEAAKVATDSWQKDRATGPTIASRILHLRTPPTFIAEEQKP